MLSFISRRRRWWQLVKEMDSSIQLSEEIRGDLLLESSNLSKTEKLMIMTSTNNDCSFEKIAAALMEQHGKSVTSGEIISGERKQVVGRILSQSRSQIVGQEDTGIEIPLAT